MRMINHCVRTVRLFLAVASFSPILGTGMAQTLQHRAEAEDKALGALSSALENIKRQAVVEYTGSCFKPSVVIAPSIQLDTSSIHGEGAASTLQGLLAKDRRFRNVTESDGIFTIAQTGIPQDFLSIRVKEVRFKEEQQNDPQLAVLALLDTPEVQEYMAAHHISKGTSFGGFISGAGSDHPHLNPVIENTTVMGVIKTILQTFSTNTHLAVYRECSASDGRRIIAITFK